MSISRKPIIGVMGGADVPEEVASLARQLGRAIAKEGWVVLSGGRDAGVMAAVSRGASEASGTVVGVLPDRDLSRASPHLTIPIRTGLGEGRNVINILSSDVVIALPGSSGTLSEINLALQNGKPLVLLARDDAENLVEIGRNVVACQNVEEVLTRIKDILNSVDNTF
jgi:uncharacterized protein (TIGR00725 family)